MSETINIRLFILISSVGSCAKAMRALLAPLIFSSALLELFLCAEKLFAIFRFGPQKSGERE